jgi:hypothetical protein
MSEGGDDTYRTPDSLWEQIEPLLIYKKARVN